MKFRIFPWSELFARPVPVISAGSRFDPRFWLVTALGGVFSAVLPWLLLGPQSQAELDRERRRATDLMAARDAMLLRLRASEVGLQGRESAPAEQALVGDPVVPADRLWLHRMAMRHGLVMDKLKPKAEPLTTQRAPSAQVASQLAVWVELKGGYSAMQTYLRTLSGSLWGLSQMQVRAGAARQHQLSLWLEPLTSVPWLQAAPRPVAGHRSVMENDPFVAVARPPAPPDPPVQIVALTPLPKHQSEAMPEHWQAELRRERQPLEAHKLKELLLTGTLRQGQTWFALVRAGTAVHTLGVGDYAGMDLGRVRAVDEEGLELREIRRDESGRWAEHLLRWRVGANP